MASFIDFCLWVFALFGFVYTLAQVWVIFWPDSTIGRRIRPAPGPSDTQWRDLMERLQEILDEIRQQRAISPPVMDVVGTVQRRRRTRGDDGSRGPTQ
jgi:hypothetical protein